LLQPGRKILALSADAETPAALAGFLVTRGFGESVLHIMEALGGTHERIGTTTAANFSATGCNKLNLVGIEVVAGPGSRIMSLASGLPDDFFEHDGQITKREVRAVTLSALSPHAGECLWDVGCGSGSVGIEWMLRDPANIAYGIESDPHRARRAAMNAEMLGVPGLRIVQARAPDGYAGLPAPDAASGRRDRGCLGGAAAGRAHGGQWHCYRDRGSAVRGAGKIWRHADADFHRAAGQYRRSARVPPGHDRDAMVGGKIMIIAGIGFSSGATAADIFALVRRVQDESGLVPAALAVPAFKTGTEMSGAAQRLGLPLLRVERDALAQAQPRCRTPSATAAAATGLASIAEACALAAAGPAAQLLVARVTAGKITCAFAGILP
jgi:precorrin-6Y C5,15-methyltransferase (decarboxylating)